MKEKIISFAFMGLFILIFYISRDSYENTLFPSAQFKKINKVIETPNSFKVSKSPLSYTYHFTILQPFSASVIFFDKYNKQINRKSVMMALVIISEDDYQDFLEMEKNKTCPASFLNDRTKTFVVLSDNQAVINTLNETSRGMKLFISGNNLLLTGLTCDVTDFFGIKYKIPPYDANYIFITDIQKY